jgi:hypothetical protein
LENPPRKVSRKLRYKAIKFVLLDGRLYYKSMDGVLLQCLGQEEARRTRASEMMEVCMSGFAEHRRAILLAVEMYRE